MKNNQAISYIMEILWLVVLILSTAKGLHILITRGFNESVYFFIIGLLALLLFLARRSLRKKAGKQNG